MKFEFPFDVGDKVFVYRNWEENDDIMGTARLRKLHKPGRSYILEDTLPESEQEVYNYQEWLVDWIIVCLDGKEHFPWKPVKIRYLDTIGIANSTAEE